MSKKAGLFTSLAMTVVVIFQAGVVANSLKLQHTVEELKAQVEAGNSQQSATDSKPSDSRQAPQEADKLTETIGAGNLKVGMGETIIDNVPENRAELSLADAGLFDLPEKQSYTNTGAYTSFELTDINFGGSVGLPVYKATNDTVGKDLVVTITSDSIVADNKDTGKNIIECIDGLLLKNTRTGKIITVNKSAGVSVLPGEAYVYFVVDNADVQTFKTGDVFEVTSANSSNDSVKISVPKNTTVTLGY